MSEPLIHIRRIKDPDATGIYVEQDDSNPQHFVVSAARRLEWLEAITEVTSYLELKARKGRDD